MVRSRMDRAYARRRFLDAELVAGRSPNTLGFLPVVARLLSHRGCVDLPAFGNITLDAKPATLCGALSDFRTCLLVVRGHQLADRQLVLPGAGCVRGSGIRRSGVGELLHRYSSRVWYSGAGREREVALSPADPAGQGFASNALGARFIGPGVLTFAMLLLWPRYFFPLVWLSLFLIIDPMNDAMGRRSLLRQAARGDWRPLRRARCGMSRLWLFLGDVELFFLPEMELPDSILLFFEDV